MVPTRALLPDQLTLPDGAFETGRILDSNKVLPKDRAVHEWYRFVLSFPPHLVRHYLERFSSGQDSYVLDPFCGTGTTLVEAKKLGVSSAGIEAHPMAHFAASTKTHWDIDPTALLSHAEKIADITTEELINSSHREMRTLEPGVVDLLLKNSVSPLPLHKTLLLLEVMSTHGDSRYRDYERLAVAKALVSGVSNLEFGPEVGVGKPKEDAPVIDIWLSIVRQMATDIARCKEEQQPEARAYHGDSRNLSGMLDKRLVDLVITSPPYPNEKDYTRTTRLESVLLGFVKSRQDLRALKQSLIRSNTRGVFKSDRDDLLINDHNRIYDIAESIEDKRLELGKTSGFERLYHRVTKLYFGGMARHLSAITSVLKPGATLAYVVGDQASYLRVMIRTGQILADIAESLGYEVIDIDLFRTRLATATKEQLREEVLLLRWPGAKTGLRGDKMARRNRYEAIIERIFEARFSPGKREVEFERDDIVRVAEELGIDLPKNLGDLIYSFRYRAALPQSIQDEAGEDVWIIRPAGRSKYRFVLVPNRPITPNPQIVATKVPDATPGIVAKYALSDEQALLARLRYNRLVDTFLGISCYSLQNHLRTSVPGIGPMETDELYVGVDKRGAHYVIPIQAKGGRDRLSIVQIEQDIALCAERFPSLICRPIGAQFMQGGVIAIFEFEEGDDGVGIVAERHYRLVLPDEVSPEDLATYQTRSQ